MIEFGVDEITLVLQVSSFYKKYFGVFNWDTVAEDMICTFVQKSEFIKVFGDRVVEQRAPAGYKIAYKFGEHNFYLAIAYNEYQMSMGVVVKFSALALDYYCEATGLKVYQFMQKIIDKKYTARLSRIDLTVDYIDEDINVTQIYQCLMDNKIGIFREYINETTGKPQYRRCTMKYEGYLKEQEVPTIYIGSVQSNSRLRIYDKRREQIERKGNKYDKAITCQDWVRFEGVFRHEYAHQISEELLNIQSDVEYANLIACILVQKFRLMVIVQGVVQCNTDYTQMILDCITNNNFILKAPSSRNYELAKNVAHIFFGSGTISTFYKIKEIWGIDAVQSLMEYILGFLQDFRPNDDCIYWLMRNESDYKKNYSNFDVFMTDNISGML